MSRTPAFSVGRVTFELDHFRMVGGDHCELQGRWFGVRGRRFMRPALTVVVDGRPTRLLADLAGKPWAAEDGQPWTAAFPCSPAGGELLDPELTVSPDVTISLPAPGGGPASGRRRAVTSRSDPREDQRRLERDLRRAESERDAALAQRDAATAARDAALAARDAACTERDAATHARDGARADHATVSRMNERMQAELTEVMSAKAAAMVMRRAAADPPASRPLAAAVPLVISALAIVAIIVVILLVAGVL